MSNRVHFAALAAAALAAAACRQDELTSPSISDAEPGGVVATVKLAHGGTITFIDLGDGQMGFAERAPASAEFVGVRMVEREQATPEEVYRALTSGAAAQSAGASTFDDPGHGVYTCEPTGVQWTADWKAAFAGITKYREATYKHNYSPAYFFYPGAAVYHGTNTNSKTYLGACNGDDEHPLDLEVHRWIGGRWKWILTARVYGGTKYTFYSGIPARYRGKAHGANGDTVEHYGVGAAWTLSPGVTTP